LHNGESQNKQAAGDIASRLSFSRPRRKEKSDLREIGLAAWPSV